MMDDVLRFIVTYMNEVYKYFNFYIVYVMVAIIV